MHGIALFAVALNPQSISNRVSIPSPWEASCEATDDVVEAEDDTTMANASAAVGEGCHVHSRVDAGASDGQILVSLDTARREIFQREGKSEVFDLISRSYSNLLRRWGE